MQTFGQPDAKTPLTGQDAARERPCPASTATGAACLAASSWIPLVQTARLVLVHGRLWVSPSHADALGARGCDQARGAGALIPVVTRLRGSGQLIVAAYPPEDN